MENTTVRERIAAQIARSDVILLMKGTPESPQCGFSAAVTKISRREIAAMRLRLDAPYQ